MTPAELSSQGTQYVDAAVKILWYVIQQLTPVVSAGVAAYLAIKSRAHHESIQDLQVGKAQTDTNINSLQNQITTVALNAQPATNTELLRASVSDLKQPASFSSSQNQANEPIHQAELPRLVLPFDVSSSATSAPNASIMPGE